MVPHPLITTQELGDRLSDPAIVVFDASWYLPTSGRDARQEFGAGHIPGARFFDLDALSDSASPLPHMMPPAGEFEACVRALGVRRESHVVVYDGSGSNLSAARAWWMFRGFGHHDVAVLDGGLRKWRQEGRRLETGEPGSPPAGDFIARLDSRQVISLEALRGFVISGGAQVVDMRSGGRFTGREPEPRPGLRGGHIPGSASVPYTELVADDGTLLGPEPLRARLARSGVDPDRPVVATCGSGVSACALLLALASLGTDGHVLYDGSWSEWGGRGDTPVARA
jgi:thiosulfate/3-mercaptopyruvate sulfurtransferase